MNLYRSTPALVPLLAVVLAMGACAKQSAPERLAMAEPELSTMKLAEPSSKVGVPVEVRYQLVGAAIKNQPATLQLAFVPQVQGTALKVEFPPSQAVAIETGASTLSVQKAQPADVYRKNLLVTPLAADSGEVRAFVSMEVDGGRYFSIFRIPLGAAPAAAEVRK